MYIMQRIQTLMQSALKSYGPAKLKQLLWDKEYSTEKWNFADNTVGDCVYSHLERHAANGSILDLGCGTGNTANELTANSYRSYLGVDISEVCLNKAMKRTQENGRQDKSDFVQSDILNYAPSQQFDVILFRESMYHVPMAKIKSTLDRYAEYLRNNGVFIVRMGTIGADGMPKSRPTAMIGVIEAEFDIVEKRNYKESGATVIVFRPRCAAHA
jgi:2-polyprenyl-3-methyl-5-hydroxy-6-metoxy-1,4-benzoquinol methylase